MWKTQCLHGKKPHTLDNDKANNNNAHYPYTSSTFPFVVLQNKNLKRPHATPLPYLFLQYSQSLIARECGFSHTQKATQLMTQVQDTRCRFIHYNV